MIEIAFLNLGRKFIKLKKKGKNKKNICGKQIPLAGERGNRVTINMAMQGYMRGQRKRLARLGPRDDELPIVHVKKERGGRFIEVAVGQQLLQLFHQIVFVRGAETAELV